MEEAPAEETYDAMNKKSSQVRGVRSGDLEDMVVVLFDSFHPACLQIIRGEK